jgi:hypothetical protein
MTDPNNYDGQGKTAAQDAMDSARALVLVMFVLGLFAIFLLIVLFRVLY